MNWKNIDQGFEPDDSASFFERKEQVWQSVQNKLKTTPIRIKWKQYIWPLAACLLIGLLTMWLTNDRPSEQTIQLPVVVLPKLDPIQPSKVDTQKLLVKNRVAEKAVVTHQKSRSHSHYLKPTITKKSSQIETNLLSEVNSVNKEVSDTVIQFAALPDSNRSVRIDDTTIIVHKNEMSRAPRLHNNSTIITKIKLRAEATNTSVPVEELTIKSLIKSFK
jgi:hypothetical protein